MVEKNKVLIVDDSPGNRMLLKYNLEEYFDVDFANNGLTALDKFARNSYDLILMDINMPHLDGIETTKTIRKLDHKQNNIPILAITSNILKGQKQRSLDAGMNDFISKPIHGKLLVDRIRYFINK